MIPYWQQGYKIIDKVTLVDKVSNIHDTNSIVVLLQ